MEIIDINTLDDIEIQRLVESATNENFTFIQRLVDQYVDGTNRFELTGECLLAIIVDEHVVGIGGLNIDPYCGDVHIGRIRHIYIMPSHRKNGYATKLVNELVNRARSHFHTVRLYTNNPIADRCYQAIGFNKIDNVHKGSHILDLNSIHANH